ncbi:MAG: putative metallopeptidase [Pirellulaceae bacterium]|nr:putative metallopeptidase [Pirellulaceae bacterium]
MDARGINFTSQIRVVIDDMIARLPELQHIDLNRVAIAFAQARNRSRYGTHATLTPMRFLDGSLTMQQGRRTYTVQRIYDDRGAELLYILTLYLPRFMDVDFHEKLVTLLHELWHINPEFNGDIRRHAGRCYAHTHSQKEYDARMEILANRWLATQPRDELLNFLKLNFSELSKAYGSVFGTRLPTPKLIAVA